jgi:hypothetical protein
MRVPSSIASVRCPATNAALLIREHGLAQSLSGLFLRGGVTDARVHAEQVVVEQLCEVIASGCVRHRADGERPARHPTQGVNPRAALPDLEEGGSLQSDWFLSEKAAQNRL